MDLLDIPLENRMDAVVFVISLLLGEGKAVVSIGLAELIKELNTVFIKEVPPNEEGMVFKVIDVSGMIVGGFKPIYLNTDYPTQHVLLELGENVVDVRAALKKRFPKIK
jgi:hypothetical protein